MKNLLVDGLGTVVKETGLTKKITVANVTKAYPVYSVRLDQLFYNDQNDRIASYISQYKAENGDEAFNSIDREEYNRIIEKFIIQSNEAAINKTQMNIALVHQRESGVILADGRVIDGNRRFTCLRRLAERDPEFNWFETIILDTDINADRKKIKLLELSIQHGEEKKVDYNPVDRLVGVYQDVIESKLITIEEYAASTNETIPDVKRRVESALLMAEFLEYINLPKQWHVAREYQAVSMINELTPLLKKCETQEQKKRVKEAVFANIMMHTVGDGKRYIRDVSKMMDTGLFSVYLRDQERIGDKIKNDLSEFEPKNKNDLSMFVNYHKDIAEDLQASLDTTLLKSKRKETRSRPSQIVSKSITLLKDVDPNVIVRLNDDEKEHLKQQLDRLSTAVGKFDSIVSEQPGKEQEKPELSVQAEKSVPEITNRYFIAKRHKDEPVVECTLQNKVYTSLSIPVELKVAPANKGQKLDFDYIAFFMDDENNVVSDVKTIHLHSGEAVRNIFSLNEKASTKTECMLALRSAQDDERELQQLVPFELSITFTSDIDF